MICKDHKSNGQSCSKDADCASGDCHKGAGDYQNKCKAPSRPAAFYAAPANFAARTSDKLQFKLDGSEGKPRDGHARLRYLHGRADVASDGRAPEPVRQAVHRRQGL